VRLSARHASVISLCGRCGFTCILRFMSTAGDVVSQGYQARKEGRLSEAREYYTIAAKIYHQKNDVLAYAHTIRHVADIFQQECNPSLAKPLYEEALEIYRSNLQTKLLDLANAIRPYALLIEERGDSTLAMKLWEEARNLYASLRISEGVSECNNHISKLKRT